MATFDGNKKRIIEINQKRDGRNNTTVDFAYVKSAFHLFAVADLADPRFSLLQLIVVFYFFLSFLSRNFQEMLQRRILFSFMLYLRC